MTEKSLTTCIVAFYSRLKTHPVLASLWLDHLEMQQAALMQLTAQAHTVEQMMASGHFPDMDLGQIAAVIGLLSPPTIVTTNDLSTNHCYRKRLKT